MTKENTLIVERAFLGYIIENENIEDMRMFKVVIDMSDKKPETENFSKLPSHVTLINMELESEIYTTDEMELYEAMDLAREIKKEVNSIFKIERYDSNQNPLGTVNM